MIEMLTLLKRNITKLVALILKCYLDRAVTRPTGPATATTGLPGYVLII